MDPQIREYINAHPSKKVKIAFPDIDGVLRGKYIAVEKFFSVMDSGMGFCNVIHGWDAADVAYDNSTFTGWQTGYPDTPVTIDVNTFRKIPWEGGTPFFLGESAPGKDALVCSRNLLKSIIGRARSMNFAPVFSQEFEWFNYEETPQSLQEKQFRNLRPITPGMFGYSLLRSGLKKEFFNDLFDLLTQFNIPVEGLHTETGPGVYEAAIAHADILEAADRAVLFKTAVKEIAYRHGIIATFMAKVDEKLPGCGGHVHQSLWSLGNQLNSFHDPEAADGISNTMKQYIAGQLYCLPQVLALFAPTVNSYKRLVEGAWAPTTVTWGIDNRTVAVRALPGSAKSSRVESRVIGADVNPYLAMAACLASGLYGISNELELTQAPISGNGYRDTSSGTLPRDLRDATEMMKQSTIAKELFGEVFHRHFVETREWEWRQHLKAVTDWELKRYFEII